MSNHSEKMSQTQQLIFRLKQSLTQEGRPFTNGEIGKLMGVTKQAVAQMVKDKKGRCPRCLRRLKRLPRNNRT